MAKAKICKRCEQEFTGARHQVRCDACRAAFRRDPDQRRKAEASLTARSAIRTGALERRPCEYVDSWSGRTCGRPKVHGHHEDYGNPLDVVWLCPYHHRLRHRELLKPSIPPLIIDRPGQPQPDRDWRN